MKEKNNGPGYCYLCLKNAVLKSVTTGFHVLLINAEYLDELLKVLPVKGFSRSCKNTSGIQLNYFMNLNYFVIEKRQGKSSARQGKNVRKSGTENEHKSHIDPESMIDCARASIAHVHRTPGLLPPLQQTYYQIKQGARRRPTILLSGISLL